MSGSRRRARTGNAAHPVVYPKPVIIIIRGEGNSESRPDQLFARSSFFFLALGKTRCRNSRVRCSWIKINDIYLLSFFLFPRITIRGESEIAYHGICRVATLRVYRRAIFRNRLHRAPRGIVLYFFFLAENRF